MKYIKPYRIFEAGATAPAALTEEQIKWLNKCAAGSWKLNRQTGLINVDGNFDCSGQGLTDFKVVKFGKVSGNFYCNNNQLTSLEGAPQRVSRGFNCHYNQLTTLEGAPQSVGRSFFCHSNQLTSLEGAPQTVGEGFYCSDNVLTSLVGAPRKVGGDFRCEDNPVSETTLKAIFALMEKGMAYQQALEEFWPDMSDEDRALIYKKMPDLSPEDVRKYKALATYGNIKGYL